MPTSPRPLFQTKNHFTVGANIVRPWFSNNIALGKIFRAYFARIPHPNKTEFWKSC